MKNKNANQPNFFSADSICNVESLFCGMPVEEPKAPAPNPRCEWCGVNNDFEVCFCNAEPVEQEPAPKPAKQYFADCRNCQAKFEYNPDKFIGKPFNCEPCQENFDKENYQSALLEYMNGGLPPVEEEAPRQIQNIAVSRMGTVRFDLAAKGHRGFQDFLFYPSSEKADKIMIQSDKRIGFYYFESGKIVLSKSRGAGSYGHSFMADKMNGQTTEVILSDAERNELNDAVRGSAGNVGTNGIIKIDNRYALQV